MSSISPLESKRFYKVKNPNKHFLCALCRAPREMRYSKHLSGKNYLQMLIFSVAFIWLGFSVFREKAIFFIFPIWLTWELVNKFLYRKDLPCPYCGFDATWYRRDVKVANRKVKEFWQQNYPELVERSKNQDPMTIISQQARQNAQGTESHSEVI